MTPGKVIPSSAGAPASPVGLATGRLQGSGDGLQELPFPTKLYPLSPVQPLFTRGLFELGLIHSFHTTQPCPQRPILLVLQLPKDKVQGVHLDLEQLYPLGREQVLGRHRYLANLCEPSQSLRTGPVTVVQLNPWEFGEGGASMGRA